MQVPHERVYKILAVDDIPDNLYLLERLVRTIPNARLYKANSGNEALQLTLEHDFCLGIIDVQMPEMDGYELVELLRGNQATAQLPVIFVSAILSDEYHHRKGYEVGAVDFMSKPFNPNILLSKIRVFTNLYEQRIQLEEWSQMLERMVGQRTDELTRAYERLAKLDKAKSDFIQVAGHELRTPLTVISGYTSALKAMFKDDPGVSAMLEGIKTGQDRLLEVINNMLYISRIDSQLLQVSGAPVSLQHILHNLISELAPALEERMLAIQTQGLKDLPMIDADPDLLSKAFEHLLINAIKFTPDGGRIEVSGQLIADTNPQQVEIQIADNGIGIEAQYLELIFDKFFQTGQVKLHSSGRTKFKGGGPGLGLAIVRGIMTAHQGRVWAKSPGYDEEACPGSIFYVRLPLQQT